MSVEARARASALASRASSSARQGFDRAASALKSLRIAIQHKAEGNHAYAAGQYERAITCYTAAIGADTEGFLAPLLLGNRSLAHMKLCQLGLARADLDEAIAIDAAAVKLRLRRAACCIELGDFAAAIADYERTLEVQTRTRSREPPEPRIRTRTRAAVAPTHPTHSTPGRSGERHRARRHRAGRGGRERRRRAQRRSHRV